MTLHIVYIHKNKTEQHNTQKHQSSKSEKTKLPNEGQDYLLCFSTLPIKCGHI